jgi:cathepsin B
MKSVLSILFVFLSLSVVIIAIPIEWDWRVETKPSCIQPSINQRPCGASWAFAPKGVLEDRYCIHSSEHQRVQLSAQYLVNCMEDQLGCLGGDSHQTFDYLQTQGNGIPTESCISYQAEELSCKQKCENEENFVKYKCKEGSHKKIDVKDIEAIKEEIWKNGPVYCSFQIYEDFLEYGSGIYYQVSKVEVEGHGIEIIGFGWENGIQFWICKNSYVS